MPDEDFGQEMLDRAMNVGKAMVRSPIANIANIANIAAKTIKKFIQLIFKLFSKIGIVAFLIGGLALFALVAADFLLEERGSSGSISLDQGYSNPTYLSDDGTITAVAYSEPQAIIDAYYKYMSANSQTKYYNGSLFNFSDSSQTRDFAGLMDYWQRENDYYVSSSFIQMVDELFHNGDFYYPEQIIKPVFYKVNDAGIIEAAPLIDRTSQPDKHTVAVQSHLYNEDNKTQGNDLAVGAWDYGLGSVLQYEKKTKDVYINCKYTGFDVDIDRLSWYEETPGHWVSVVSHEDIITIPVGEDDSPETLKQKIFIALGGSLYDYTGVLEYPTPTMRHELEQAGARHIGYVFVSPEHRPSDNMLKAMCNEALNSRIPQTIDTVDALVSSRDFDSSALKTFSNAGANRPVGANNDSRLFKSQSYYPINIPVLVSAASLAGTVKYEYEGIDVSEKELTPGTGIPVSDGGVVTDSNKFCNWELDATEIICGCSCSVGGSGQCNLKAYRSGKICTEVPQLKEQKEEYWGYEYVDDYASLYSSYVPMGVMSDLDFTQRAREGETWDTLKELGLLQPYTGGFQEAVSAVSSGDLDIVASLICAEAGNDFLDELMTGAVLVNQHKKSGYDYLGTVSMGDGAQHPSWVDGSFRNAVPTSRDRLAARLVLSGEFSVPANVCFQATESENASNVFLFTQSGHYYCYESGFVADSKDVFGRFSKTASEIRELVPRLEEKYGMASGTATSLTVLQSANEPFLSLEDLPAGQNYYSIREFDVAAAVSGLQKFDSGDTSWIGKIAGVVGSFFQKIGKFFTEVSDVFSLPDVSNSERVLYSRKVPVSDIRDAVIQAVTFANKNLPTYTEAAEAIKSLDNLSFLFAGKTSLAGGLGFQLTMMPSVATKIEGFISPTDMYYQTTESYSVPSHQYSVVAAPKGTPVISIGAGTVKDVNTANNSVAVDYVLDGKRYTVIYGRLDTISVAIGAAVSQKQQIGTVGSNGLYFGFQIDGVFVNPMSYFYQPAYGNSAIVAVAMSQVGNVGGVTYRSWAHAGRVNWCAIFCSWCANQLGYIDSGVFRNFQSCSENWSYFAQRGKTVSNYSGDTLYQPGYTPVAGDLILFCWDKVNGHMSANTRNHVGIVVKCENGIVYTVEGNSGSSDVDHSQVKYKHYSMTDPNIHGYIHLDYSTPVA